MVAVHRSRKLIPDFRLLRPRDAAEAAALQARSPCDTVFMAGGLDLSNRLKYGNPVTTVVHLGAIDGRLKIRETPEALIIGAGVSHHQLQTSTLARTRLPELCATWGTIGNIRIRLKGTVGGNIMAREAAYDMLLALMAVGAHLRFMSADGTSWVVDAANTTDALGQPISLSGLLLSIEVPHRRGLRLVFNRALRPTLSMAIALEVTADAVTSARVAFGCAFAAPLLVTIPIGNRIAVRDLQGNAADLAHEVATKLPEPLNDANGSSAYRRRMAEVILRRHLLGHAGQET
jgi:carbon-monoxide dehydrogenase medium subunit